jgi:hypothetical protein
MNNNHFLTKVQFVLTDKKPIMCLQQSKNHITVYTETIHSLIHQQTYFFKALNNVNSKYKKLRVYVKDIK